MKFLLYIQRFHCIIAIWKFNRELALLQQRLQEFSVVAILGPRQCGKTTLSHQFAHHYSVSPIHFFDLEDPRDLAKLENPLLTLENLTGVILIS